MHPLCPHFRSRSWFFSFTWSVRNSCSTLKTGYRKLDVYALASSTTEANQRFCDLILPISAERGISGADVIDDYSSVDLRSACLPSYITSVAQFAMRLRARCRNRKWRVRAFFRLCLARTWQVATNDMCFDDVGLEHELSYLDFRSCCNSKVPSTIGVSVGYPASSSRRR